MVSQHGISEPLNELQIGKLAFYVYITPNHHAAPLVYYPLDLVSLYM